MSPAPAKFEEQKHKRSQTGQFAAKPKARLSGAPTSEPKVKVTPRKKSAPVSEEMRTLNAARTAANRKRLAENRERAEKRRQEVAHAERVSIRNQRALSTLFPKQAAKAKREANAAGKKFLKALAEGKDFEAVNAEMMPAYQKRQEWTRGYQRNIMSRIQAERRRLWQEKKDIRATPELMAIKKGGTKAEQDAAKRAEQRGAWERANPGAVRRQREARAKQGDKGKSTARKKKTTTDKGMSKAEREALRKRLEREYAWITASAQTDYLPRDDDQ